MAVGETALRVLHAIHDFLPRHRAGSEIYALNLCRELQNRHHVTVLCADYDPTRDHGSVAWRLHDGVPVAEIANNWTHSTFVDTYRSPLITKSIGRVLDAVQPDVVHVHNLLNLSFDLPALARSRGVPVVATLHDYTLVCTSGGQRVHRRERHLCESIEPDRCARCFGESPFHAQMAVGRVSSALGRPGPFQRLARWGRHLLPTPVVTGAARLVGRAAGSGATPSDIADRLTAARRVFEDVDHFVAPSQSLADEYVRLGLSADKLTVSDYGFSPVPRTPHVPSPGTLRIGYVGSIVWHKGVHVLLDAARRLPPDGWVVKVFGHLGVAPDYVASLRQAAEGLAVRFEGPFTQEQTADVFAGIDVLVVPSLWLENSPLVIHEAFMTGTPVVGSRLGGTTSLVRDGVDGLLYDATSPDDLASCLRGLLDDPSRLGALARNVPSVKTIAADTEEWERRYAEVTATSTR